MRGVPLGKISRNWPASQRRRISAALPQCRAMVHLSYEEDVLVAMVTLQKFFKKM
jgi:hypothetical protein